FPRVTAVATVEGDPARVRAQDGRSIFTPQAALCVSERAISSASAAVTARLVVRSMASRAATAAVFVRAHDVVVRDVVENTDYVSGVSRGQAGARRRSPVALGAHCAAAIWGRTRISIRCGTAVEVARSGLVSHDARLRDRRYRGLVVLRHREHREKQYDCDSEQLFHLKPPSILCVSFVRF